MIKLLLGVARSFGESHRCPPPRAKTLCCTGTWTGKYLTVAILIEELAASHRLRALDLALYHGYGQGRRDILQRINLKKIIIQVYEEHTGPVDGAALKGLCAGFRGQVDHGDRWSSAGLGP